MENIFEKASRVNLTFNWGQGISSVNDAWKLSISKLKAYGMELETKLKAVKQVSDRYSDDEVQTSPENETLMLQEAIINHIYSTKKAEAKARIADNDAAQKEQRILELIVQKQEEALKGETVEQLQARLAEIQNARKKA